eukprot:3708956-Rhodomonas_salina.2
MLLLGPASVKPPEIKRKKHALLTRSLCTGRVLLYLSLQCASDLGKDHGTCREIENMRCRSSWTTRVVATVCTV